MPIDWEDRTKEAPVRTGAFSFDAGNPPVLHIVLWPHRSLPRRGFAWVILLTFGMLLVPLLAVLGTLVLWGLLPFLMGALALLWYFLDRNYKDGALTEELRLWSDRIELHRTNPRGPPQDWHANPHWVRINLDRKDGPVENYVTLKGNGREVEIGAFLSPDERAELHDRLAVALARV